MVGSFSVISFFIYFVSSKLLLFLLSWLIFPCIQLNSNVKSEAHAIMFRPKYYNIIHHIIIIRTIRIIWRKINDLHIFMLIFLTALRFVTNTIAKFTPNSACKARNILQRLIREKFHNINELMMILPRSIQKKILTDLITCHKSSTALYCQ